MILLIILVIAAVLVVVCLYLIKKTAREKISGIMPKSSQLNTSGPTPSSPNPGSIPDPAGTKGDGNSALSSGRQG